MKPNKQLIECHMPSQGRDLLLTTTLFPQGKSQVLQSAMEAVVGEERQLKLEVRCALRYIENPYT